MSVRQSGMPATDEDIKRASIDGAAKRIVWQQPRNQTDAIACRLYPSLSFFFDGTNNNLERDQPINKHSNIAKLFQAAVVRRRYEAKPIYLPGVGTPFRFEKVVGYTDHLKDDDGGVFGLGLGAGGDLRIKFALGEFSRLLEVEFGPGSWRHMREITVAIFGFSRGATEARAFARGLVTQKCLKDDGGLYWRAPNLVRVPLRINFMGIFDTVASVGGPALHLDWASELAIPAEVERCVHYVAAHEVRRAFPLDSVRIDTSYQNNCEEIVYPGVHSDVGGGYAPDEQGRDKDLSFISLRHMFIEALRAGVPLMSLDEMPSSLEQDFELADDAPVVTLYNDYMAALPAAPGSDLESLIQPHRYLNFRWRSILARHQADERVLGHLYEKVGAAFCSTVPAGSDEDHPACQPNEWVYDVPKNPEEQAKQLLREQRRLERHIEFLRNPIESRAGNRSYPPQPRELRPYEKMILAAWDEAGTIPLAVDQLLAEHIHESVAAFRSWPCALWDQRGIYCDGTRYMAQNDPISPDDAAVA
ncbi:T6SS phospholipase effector Tle1-like catalytic domain-containing protein [Burkholderia gladioli]|uniref:T6SS phospholipase effector Tle1-like catalytic domain-containing protein n=1 Tax=Burkholderia gladioli TaxID=28095 RepID=UPI0034DB2B45